MRFFEAYGIHPAEIPILEGVGFLEFNGIARTAAKALKARFPAVRIHGAKPDAWIAANIDNPLRDWVDDHERATRREMPSWSLLDGAVSMRRPPQTSDMNSSRLPRQSWVWKRRMPGVSSGSAQTMA